MTRMKIMSHTSTRHY